MDDRGDRPPWNADEGLGGGGFGGGGFDLGDIDLNDWIRYGKFALAALVVVALLGALSWGLDFYVDWLWFDSLGHPSLLLTVIGARIAAFVVAAAVAVALTAPNAYLVFRATRGPSSSALPADLYPKARRLLAWASAAGVGVVGFLLAEAAAMRWDAYLRYLYGVSFDHADPVFERDLSFYVFDLPVLRFVQSWLLGALAITLVIVAVLYYVIRWLRGRRLPFESTPRTHLTALGAALFLVIAWGHWLARFELLYSPSGTVYGVGYTEAYATLPAYGLMTAVALFASILLMVAIARPGNRLIVSAVAGWFVINILAGSVYPSLVQRFRVEPSELAREEAYLDDHIAMTRQAYGLEGIRSRSHPARGNITTEIVADNRGTIENVRLWDEGPLLDSYNQIQFFRLYYDFLEVTTDRYEIDGDLRQVMLSTRELSPEKLPQEAQRWVNRHLQFTHGYGAAMSPVTEVAPDGRPAFFLKDVPPQGELPLERSEIYYGLKSLEYVVADTRMQEFNYPGPDGPVYTHYQGDGGVSVGSWLRRLVYSWHFGDVNLLISSEITEDSRIQYHRPVPERFAKLTPFLVRDSKPYSVVADGRLLWIQDAYTVTDRFPYSTPWDGRFNYIRNSVKAVIDAYDGSVDYYVADPDDPLIQTYQAIFPDTFRPLEEMPDYLKSHIRYPRDYFTVQVEMLRQYQMRDPVVFYNKEDQWSLPVTKSFGQTQTLRPYYIVARLPGETDEEFLLIQPFTPDDRHNLVAWIAARNDPEHYGELVLFRFPAGRHVDGPNQVSARIDNDPVISEQFTLWGQVGSTVSQGILLVIPMGDAIFYAEPVFLRPQTLDFPELRRIILADAERVVMHPTLQRSVDALVGEAPAVAAPSEAGGAIEELAEERPAGPTPEAEPGDMVTLDRERLDRLSRSLEDALDRLERVLEEIRRAGEQSDTMDTDGDG